MLKTAASASSSAAPPLAITCRTSRCGLDGLALSPPIWDRSDPEMKKIIRGHSQPQPPVRNMALPMTQAASVPLQSRLPMRWARASRRADPDAHRAKEPSWDSGQAAISATNNPPVSGTDRLSDPRCERISAMVAVLAIRGTARAMRVALQGSCPAKGTRISSPTAASRSEEIHMAAVPAPDLASDHNT